MAFFMQSVLAPSFCGGTLDFGKVGVWLAPNNFRLNSIPDVLLFVYVLLFGTGCLAVQ